MLPWAAGPKERKGYKGLVNSNHLPRPLETQKSFYSIVSHMNQSSPRHEKRLWCGKSLWFSKDEGRIVEKLKRHQQWSPMVKSSYTLESSESLSLPAVMQTEEVGKRQDKRFVDALEKKETSFSWYLSFELNWKCGTGVSFLQSFVALKVFVTAFNSLYVSPTLQRRL